MPSRPESASNALSVAILLRWVLLVSIPIATGCQSMYYKSMEAFGVHKREILVDRVEDARDSQKEAKEQFSSALERFTTVVDFRGGKLEEHYERLQADLNRSESKAKAVRNRIDEVENVAKALFKEWEKELNEYTSGALRQDSAAKLEQTKRRYVELMGFMRQAEARMEPVLLVFRDNVLFLKHNLNAQAVASLEDERVRMEADVKQLIREMEASIREADSFIEGMADGT